MDQKQISTIKKHLTVKGGRIFTTSLDVANFFDKKHKDVLRAIYNLECSAEFTERNLAPSEYKDPTGRMLPMVEMTRDGFTMLAFGFTGAPAVRWREAYIAAFNQMEAAVMKGSSADLHQAMLDTPVIQNLISVMSDLMVKVGKLVAQGDLVPAGGHAKPMYTFSTDHIRNFIDRHCAVDCNALCEKYVLYRQYEAWCGENGEVPYDYNNFFKALYQTGIPVRKTERKDRRHGTILKMVRGLGVL